MKAAKLLITLGFLAEVEKGENGTNPLRTLN